MAKERSAVDPLSVFSVNVCGTSKSILKLTIPSSVELSLWAVRLVPSESHLLRETTPVTVTQPTGRIQRYSPAKSTVSVSMRCADGVLDRVLNKTDDLLGH